MASIVISYAVYDMIDFYKLVPWNRLYINCISPPDDVTGQLTTPPPTCPGDTFTFTCTVSGDRSGFTIWRVNGNSECTLRHGSTSPTCQPSDAFTARGVTGFGTTATSYSSTLSGTATSELNGTLVECFGPAFSRDAENRVGRSTLLILGQYTYFLQYSCFIAYHSKSSKSMRTRGV